MLSHIGCKHALDHSFAHQLALMNGESCQDIEFCFLEEFKGLRNVVVLKHTDIIVADREGMS